MSSHPPPRARAVLSDRRGAATVVSAARRYIRPIPMKTMPGMSFHDAVSATSATIPVAIHDTATTNRNAGGDGRRPTCRGEVLGARLGRPGRRGVACGPASPSNVRYCKSMDEHVVGNGSLAEHAVLAKLSWALCSEAGPVTRQQRRLCGRLCVERPRRRVGPSTAVRRRRRDGRSCGRRGREPRRRGARLARLDPRRPGLGRGRGQSGRARREPRGHRRGRRRPSVGAWVPR